MQGTIEQRIAEKFAVLNNEQRIAVYQHMQQQGIIFAQIPIVPSNKSRQTPLSFAQLRQWFLWHLDPLGTAYHISGALQLSGALDVVALQSSFVALLARHEALRTVFQDDEQGNAWQQVLPEGQLDFRQLDLSELADAEQDAAVLAAADAINQQPFDLRGGPLLRVGLLRRSDEQHVLVVVMHHIISDGWSMNVIINEFVALYRQQVLGDALHLPELPIQYADYAQWQRSWLAAGEQERQLAYWQTQLGGDQPVLQLNTDFPRRADGQYRAARLSLDLPAQLAQSLNQIARTHSATLFMALLASWQVLLQRYTGLGDIRVGVPIANRHRAETANLVGFFVNTQVLNNRLHGELTLEQALLQAKAAALGAQEHQDLPFEQLVEALQIERSLGQNPLFQVMFNHQRAGNDALQQLPSLQLSDYALGEKTAQFELTLDTIEQRDGQISFTLTYAAELFHIQTIERMAQHYVSILEQLAATPQQSLASLNFLCADEIAQLNAWGTNPQRCDASQPVHRLIEAQVAQRPDATALIFGEVELTYAELNQRANQLAHYLIEQGIGLESKVGIALERSVEMVVALLAVLKAGGAYVPLDPEYPQDRLGYMVADSGINALLTNTSLIHRIPSASSQVIVLDTLDLSVQSTQNPDVAIHGDNLAYVIYTSGSTGKPKGVAVTHAPLAMHVLSIGERYGMTPADRELQFASINFDGAHERWLVPLAFGAALLPRDNELWDVQRTCDEIQRHGITIACFTPSYLHQLAEIVGEAASQLPIRSYTVGGEAMSRASFDLVQRVLKPPRMINGYGPTETVITPMIATMYPGDTFDSAYMPIGTLVGDRTGYVLDAELNLVPQGTAGELYLGGIGLARGYLNRAELSAERFVSDLFDTNGGRLYRTGDLVRWRADGQLEYLGRLDHQVKIRGFRIELGEIEAQLLAQESVREAVVVAQDGSGGVRLVGYVSPHSGITLDTAQLKSAIATVLPDYMMPSILVALEFLPLNPNGKIDRKALPKPERASQFYEAPQNEVETTLAQIWAEVLELERVGRSDNFFELGGNSILSLKCIAIAKNRHNLLLTVMDMMKAPTPFQLALLLSKTIDALIEDGKPPVFLFHDGWGGFTDYKELINALSSQYSVICVSTDFSNLSSSSVNDLIDIYCKKIIKTHSAGGYKLIGWSLGGLISILVAEKLEELGCDVCFVGMVDSFLPIKNKEPTTWVEEFLNFMSIIIPKKYHLILLNNDDFADCLRSSDINFNKISSLVNFAIDFVSHDLNDEYIGLDCDSIVYLFESLLLLKKIFSKVKTIPKVNAKVKCWWSVERNEDEYMFLYDEKIVTGYDYDACTVNKSHLEIIKDSELVIEIVSKVG
ncbi:non-ribosomal peptide synthetase [Deefgea rivuli]|uniref:non-ribosomal peptide synthetase n=1 Tax=Deefgea rivuli TaxID=400948 RepID=UPI0006879E73|nr:non-ribosomal peptide synthetase [Deefgea rivuli]